MSGDVITGYDGKPRCAWLSSGDTAAIAKAEIAMILDLLSLPGDKSKITLEN